MAESIRILIVEDLPTDAELAERKIKKTLKSCCFQRVETRSDYLAALEEFQPDLIVSDYQMPHFDGLTALKLVLEYDPLIPLIILTGAINEDTAVEWLRKKSARNAARQKTLYGKVKRVFVAFMRTPPLVYIALHLMAISCWLILLPCRYWVMTLLMNWPNATWNKTGFSQTNHRARNLSLR